LQTSLRWQKQDFFQKCQHKTDHLTSDSITGTAIASFSCCQSPSHQHHNLISKFYASRNRRIRTDKRNGHWLFSEEIIVLIGDGKKAILKFVPLKYKLNLGDKMTFVESWCKFFVFFFQRERERTRIVELEIMRTQAGGANKESFLVQLIQTSRISLRQMYSAIFHVQSLQTEQETRVWTEVCFDPTSLEELGDHCPICWYSDGAKF
jgi:hypothetical protein